MSALPTDSTPLYRPLAESAARISLRAASSDAGRASVFEVVSRGDFVPGRLDQPADSHGNPVLLVLGGSDAWTRGIDHGLAVARIDLPLLGTRQSPKLTDRLLHGHAAWASDVALDADTRALVEEFARQSISDVVRTLEALSAEGSVDGSRVALVGAGIGASAAAWALPVLPTLRACVLAGPSPGRSDAGLDPVAPLAAATLGDIACQVLAPGGGDAAATALSASLPGSPRFGPLAATSEDGDLASSDIDSILEFVKAALGR